jgi:hypothetical protein
MPFSARVLADGQLPDAQAAIYTVPFGAAAYVKQLLLFNTNAAAQTIDVWLNTSGTPRQWHRLVLQENEAAPLLEHGESLQLESGDTVEAVTTTAGAVDFTITGVEET